ncbi:MAG: YqaA family protein [Rhodospirillaceae bacterium]
MIDIPVYLGLFALAFLAATILPAQSEIGLAGLILSGDYNLALLITSAGLGNTLGAVVNWGLGKWSLSFRHKKWFPLKPRALERSCNWYRRYGRWSLLFSWAPFIGDPLTIVAGILKEPIWSFLVIVCFAKTLRYIFVAAIALKLF